MIRKNSVPAVSGWAPGVGSYVQGRIPTVATKFCFSLHGEILIDGYRGGSSIFLLLPWMEVLLGVSACSAAANNSRI